MAGRLDLALLVLLFLCAPLWSQTTNPTPAKPGEASTQIEGGTTYESLTNGYEPWKRAYLLVIRRTDRKAFYGNIDETNRYSLTDTEFSGGAVYPLGRQWSALFEGTLSPTHHVVGKWSTLGQIERSFGKGWTARAGLRHREYNVATVNIGNFGLEKYIRNYRIGYTFYPSHLQKAGSAAAHRIETGYEYGNSTLNLNVAAGEELENIVPAGVLRTKVKLLNAGGTHWFAPAWALSYSLGWHIQGKSYTRRGLSIGLRRRL